MRSKYFQLKRDRIYESIITEQDTMSLTELCVKLNISQSTYYRILKEYNPKETIPKKSKKIQEPISAGNVTVDLPKETILTQNNCYIDNCPTNTRELFDKDHELYCHMMISHPNDVSSLSK